MCPFSIVLITKILEEYIQKYSSVFNRIAIVPRYANYAPEYLESPLTKVYNDVVDEEFRQVSNIYSDVVHFTDGNPGF